MNNSIFSARKWHFLIFAFVSLLVSCEADDPNPPIDSDGKEEPVPEIADEVTLTNVSYGADPLQVFDAYLPEGRTTDSTNVLVLVHGGFWFAGDKADWAEHIEKIRKTMPETAIFNINYRLKGSENGEEYAFDQQLGDLAAFLQHLKSKKEEFAVRDQIALFGFSAGAHMSMHYAYSHPEDKTIKVVGNMSGLNNLMDPAYSAGDDGFKWLLFTITQSLTGVPFEGNPDFYEALSPYYLATDQAPPTLILHGENDPVLPLSQPDNLKGKLDSLGVPNQYKLYEAEEHGWESDANWEDTFERLRDFMAEHMQ